jgi:hypothetical protein
MEKDSYLIDCRIGDVIIDKVDDISLIDKSQNLIVK